MKIEMNWLNTGMQFSGKDEKGNVMTLDGESKTATSPMTALLFATAACAGSDIVSLFEKMKQDAKLIAIEVEGDRRSEGEYPRLWEKVHIIFRFQGQLEPIMVNKAVNLSMEKYCSVSGTLKKGGEVTWEVKIEE